MIELTILWYDVLKGIGVCKDSLGNEIFINSSLTRLGKDKDGFFKLVKNAKINGFVVELGKGELVLDFFELC